MSKILISQRIYLWKQSIHLPPVARVGAADVHVWGEWGATVSVHLRAQRGAVVSVHCTEKVTGLVFRVTRNCSRRFRDLRR